MRILPFGSAGKDLACFLVPQNSVIFRFDNRYHTEFISFFFFYNLLSVLYIYKYMHFLQSHLLGLSEIQTCIETDKTKS